MCRRCVALLLAMLASSGVAAQPAYVVGLARRPGTRRSGARLASGESCPIAGQYESVAVGGRFTAPLSTVVPTSLMT